MGEAILPMGFVPVPMGKMILPIGMELSQEILYELWECLDRFEGRAGLPLRSQQALRLSP
jgi:hypothetical protein